MPPFWSRRTPQQLGFRSGLESANEAHLKKHGDPAAYEQLKVRYAIPETFHIYHPDFELANGIIVETKGRFLAADRTKMLLVRATYPELDIRFVFSRAKTPITTGSKTTVAMWSTKHGFPYAEKLIPVAWLKEAGPKRKPREVLAR